MVPPYFTAVSRRRPRWVQPETVYNNTDPKTRACYLLGAVPRLLTEASGSAYLLVMPGIINQVQPAVQGPSSMHPLAPDLSLPGSL